MGNDEIYTPNLDKLANNGVLFTNAYNMGAWHGAICVASRAMMISGKSVWRAKDQISELKKGDSVLAFSKEASARHFGMEVADEYILEK